MNKIVTEIREQTDDKVPFWPWDIEQIISDYNIKVPENVDRTKYVIDYVLVNFVIH